MLAVDRLRRGAEGLPPAYFALVMATGIVSIAASLRGYPRIAGVLLALNAAFYATLWALAIWRVVSFPRRVLADLLDHQRSVGFFTIVAGTSVLGSQVLLLAGSPGLATALWIVALVLWALLTYGIYAILTVKAVKPSLAEGIHGGWLLGTVAAQSIAVLGGQLASRFEAREPILFFVLVVWLGGGMLYLWTISLIFYRYVFFPLAPSDLAPPYWINMGAVAISTLAGVGLLAASPGVAFLERLRPFVEGFTLFFWATATWWIPMLLVLGWWRHVLRRFPIRYDPLYWGAVFPLGMYTVATHRLAEISDLPFLDPISRTFLWIALAAWTATFLGLVRSLASGR